MADPTKTMTTDELRERMGDARADWVDGLVPETSQMHGRGAFKAYKRCLPIAEERDRLIAAASSPPAVPTTDAVVELCPDVPETTEALRKHIKAFENDHEKSLNSHDSLSYHNGDMALELRIWALPIAVQRDEMAAIAARRRSAVSAIKDVARDEDHYLLHALCEATGQPQEHVRQCMADSIALGVYKPPVNSRAGRAAREKGEVEDERDELRSALRTISDTLALDRTHTVERYERLLSELSEVCDAVLKEEHRG